jgi:sulfite reductase (NADPH) hemoprotein beta-component
MAGGALAIKGPSIPSARIETAVERMKTSYASSRILNETFSAWIRRVGKDHLTSLLGDLTEVKPEELESVLRDHGKDAENVQA